MANIPLIPHLPRILPARLVAIGAATLLLVGAFTACGKVPTAGPLAAVAPVTTLPTHITLTIVAQKPGGSLDGPAYTPNTDLTLPAHSVVTITIINNDPGDTLLPSGSPFNTVRGVIGGVAFLDGRPYKSLAPDKVAHTFTVPLLGITVPIPGDVPTGHKDISVTFAFRTGAAGHYYWQCMDPCGSGSSGWGGPMTTTGYMRGALTVQA